MLYIINGQIIYDDVQCSISNAETNDTMQLPATAARILSLFIRYHGSTLSRAEILSYVWEEYGYKASNNTLSQYVSLIRKNFQHLGLQTDLIITIPRTGFLLPKSVEVKVIINRENTDVAKDESLYSDNNIVAGSVEENQQRSGEMNENSILMLSVEKSTKTNNRYNMFFSWPLYFNIMSAIIFFLICYLAFKQKDNIQHVDIYQIGKIETCPVFMFYRSAKEMLSERLAVTEKISKKYLPCKPGMFYLTQQEDTLAFSHTGRIFIGRCAYQENSSQRLSGCKSIYLHE